VPFAIAVLFSSKRDKYDEGSIPAMEIGCCAMEGYSVLCDLL